MKTLYLCLLALLCTAGNAFAQKKSLTIEQAVLQGKTALSPAKLNQVGWIKGSSDYFYVNAEEALMRSRGIAANAKVVLPLTKLNEVLKKAGIDSVKKFPEIKWNNSNEFEFTAKNTIIRYNLKNNKSLIYVELPADAANIDKAGNSYAYTKDDFNLYIHDGSKEIKVSPDGNRDVVYGRTAHREEFGIKKGTFWSPSGNKLAFYRMDQSMVTDYPIVDFSIVPARANAVKYPFAGDSSHHVTVGIYNVETKSTIYLQTGQPADQYLTNIAWSNDASTIYIAVVNREQDHMKLNSYDAASGKFISTLFEEKHDKYVEPLHPLEFVKGNDSLFIWQSRRDGFNHLYLYSISGKLINQITKGKWEVTDLAGFDHLGKSVFFTSTFNSPVNRDFCSADIMDGSVTTLTKGSGVHKCQINENGTAFIDTYTSRDDPGKTTLHDIPSGKQSDLLTPPDPLKDYITGNTKIFTIKGSSGDDLYCRMILPPGFDERKKYPVFIYVYGGPHVQMITNSWLGGADLWQHALAEKGYIIFSMDNRGTSNRGREFEQSIFRNIGEAEVKDLLTGVEYLKTLSYVDQQRMGINGWSYGGFLTVSLMTRHPGVFKVAVAGGPVIDWSLYEVMYTERYMDTPQQNASGYNKSNLLNYIDNIQGKMMLIHGTSDDVVVWQQSLRYIKEAVSKGKQLDYFVYPGHLHNVIGKDRVHLITKIIDYITENL